MSDHFTIGFHRSYNRGSPELADAIKRGDLPAVKSLVKRRAKVDGQVPVKKDAPVTLAAKFGHHEILALLIEMGANPNSADPFFSPLVVGLKNIDRAIVKTVLPYHEKMDESICAALKAYDDKRAERGYHELYAYAFWRMSNLSRRRNFYRLLLPHFNLSKVAGILGRACIDFNFKVSTHSKDRSFLWLRYALKEDPAAIETLLEWGALPDYLDNDLEKGRTFLHDLVLGGHFEILDVALRERPVTVDVRDIWRGWTPLHYAALRFKESADKDSNIRCLKLLFDQGATVDLPDIRNRTPLALALRLYLEEEERENLQEGICLETVEALLDGGAEPHALVSFDKVSIMEAVKKSYPEGVPLRTGEIVSIARVFR